MNLKKAKKWLYLLVMSLLVACGSKNKVVVYTTAPPEIVKPLIEDCEDKTDLNVEVVYEAQNDASNGIFKSILEGKESPACDVFLGNTPIESCLLKASKLTQAINTPIADSLASVFVDFDKQWLGFAGNARIAVYNSDSMHIDDAPRSIYYLEYDFYRNKIALANQQSANATLFWASLFTVQKGNQVSQLLTNIAKNKITFLDDEQAVIQMIESGKAQCGIINSDLAFKIAESSKVDYVYLNQQDIGALVVPLTVSIMKNSARTEAANKFIAYLLSKDAANVVAKDLKMWHLNPTIQIENVPLIKDLTIMRVDYNLAVTKLDSVKEVLKVWSAK